VFFKGDGSQFSLSSAARRSWCRECPAQSSLPASLPMQRRPMQRRQSGAE
jgi:hypothetical protein